VTIYSGKEENKNENENLEFHLNCFVFLWKCSRRGDSSKSGFGVNKENISLTI